MCSDTVCVFVVLMFEFLLVSIYIYILSVKLYIIIKANISEFGDRRGDIIVVCLPAVFLALENWMDEGSRPNRTSVYLTDLAIQSLLVFRVISSVYNGINGKAILSFIEARIQFPPSVYA